MAQKTSPVVKVLLIFLTLVVLFMVAALGSCVYIAYRAKKKADEIQQAYKSGDLEKVAEAVGIGRSSESEKSRTAATTLSFPPWSPSSSAPTKIPVVVGLTAVAAVAQPAGDYQSVMMIQKVDPDQIELTVRADNVPNPLGKGLAKLAGQKEQPDIGTVLARRVVLAEDMRNAHELQEWFAPNHPDVFAGTTAVTVSREVLSELKEKGQTSFRFGRGGVEGMFGSMVGGLAQFAKEAAPNEAKQAGGVGKADCTLKRVGEVAYPVLLNDKRVSLPAVHAQCAFVDGTADFYFLDDLDNPANLAFTLGNSGTVQVISISYPVEHPKAKTVAPSGIETDLEQKGKAEVYGIYFDFSSDKMKPESEIVLREMASALEHNPSWKLQVEGHTDNVGGDAYNLELSQRRAKAVKEALVTRYKIAEDRLAPEGFGATRPKEPNDTVAGRARNRRVELVRK